MSDNTQKDDDAHLDETDSGEESIEPIAVSELAQVHHRMGIAGRRLNDAHSHLAEAYAWREDDTMVKEPQNLPREELTATLVEVKNAIEKALQRLEAGEQTGEQGDQTSKESRQSLPGDMMAWNRNK